MEKQQEEIEKYQEKIKKQYEEKLKKMENTLKKANNANENNLLELIKSMLKKKYQYEDISELTNKSIDEIKKIEKSI